MKPHLHCKNSVKLFGGKPEDYLPVHSFIDSTKAHVPDVRHRAIFHNSFGCYIAEQVFGYSIVNSDGNEVSVRDIAENHILEDLGYIPTLQDFLKDLPIKEWYGGMPKRSQKFKLDMGDEKSMDAVREMIADGHAPLNVNKEKKTTYLD